ncbi:hypothetical protein PISMIDRAFT_683905 [Pisolithus microcarpus 441]|uniref:Uncharacterized protein n=1 Tax=Pisolithus microcarpus 441 TaxID=765257 RepID=A0A0C9YY60_9AGAM|nr:hypothetical protein PISMIDRAFT_683905 [Pisolithus microcarpus 441]
MSEFCGPVRHAILILIWPNETLAPHVYNLGFGSSNVDFRYCAHVSQAPKAL